MCTLIVARNGANRHFPLVVATNRDESPTRPSADPDWQPGGFYAPLDLVRGGSWIGVNRHGLVAALTNRFLAPRYRRRRSRGLLVTDALAARTTAEAVAAIKAQPAGTYNGFQLFLDDGREAALVWSDAGDFRVQRLGDGLWVFTGDDRLPGVSLRAGFVIANIATQGWPRRSLPQFQNLLSLHDPDDAETGTCVHGPGVTMETVSSMVIRRSAKKDDPISVAWRTGRPCLGGPWHETSLRISPPADNG